MLELPPLEAGQVLHDDRVEDDGGDAAPRLGELGGGPVRCPGAIHWDRDLGRQLERGAKAPETFHLSRPDEGEQRQRSLLGRRIDRPAIAPMSLDDLGRGRPRRIPV